MEPTFLGASSNSLVRLTIRIFAMIVIAVVAFQARRRLIAHLFVDALPLEHVVTSEVEGVDLSSWPRNQVLILDGLDLEIADKLVYLAKICDQGLRVTIDVGFPTVSLPVQHVLWTGLTQEQSGIQYRISALDPAPDNAIPKQIPDSVAIVQDHLEIAQSFGFARIEPGPQSDNTAWKQHEFFARSQNEVQQDHALLMIHVLSIDAAGHRWGKDSTQYVHEAQRVDRWLGNLAFRHSANRLFVLSDHGHRSEGGHGGSEPAIRMVRACIVGPGIEVDTWPNKIELVDFSRALSSSLGLEIDPRSLAHPLFVAGRRDHLRSTLPTVSFGALCLATLWAFAGAGLVYRKRPLFPFCFFLAGLGAQIISGPISLSCPAIYPPWGLKLLQGTWPGIVLFGIFSWQWLYRRSERIFSELVIGLWFAGLLLLLSLGFGGTVGLSLRWLPYYGANLIAILWIVSALASTSAIVGFARWIVLAKTKATR